MEPQALGTGVLAMDSLSCSLWAYRVRGPGALTSSFSQVTKAPRTQQVASLESESWVLCVCACRAPAPGMHAHVVRRWLCCKDPFVFWGAYLGGWHPGPF